MFLKRVNGRNPFFQVIINFNFKKMKIKATIQNQANKISKTSLKNEFLL